MFAKKKKLNTNKLYNLNNNLLNFEFLYNLSITSVPYMPYVYFINIFPSI